MSRTGEANRTAASFAQAKSLAAETGKPVLIKVGAGGCQSCSDFDTAAAGATEVRDALAGRVVLLIVRGDQDEGIDIARMYSVNHQYPSFLLVNGDGELLDRWSGYYKPEEFITNLSSAVKVAFHLGHPLDQDEPLDAKPIHEGSLVPARGASPAFHLSHPLDSGDPEDIAPNSAKRVQLAAGP